LIVPLLASEFTDSSNLPVFENILRQLKDAAYLSQIIFGLDGASESDAFLLQKLIQKYGIKNSLIQWNSGPGFDSIYNQLNEAGFHILEPGKGKNMFLSFGIAIALGADSIGLVDADIRTFKLLRTNQGTRVIRQGKTATPRSTSPFAKKKVYRKQGRKNAAPYRFFARFPLSTLWRSGVSCGSTQKNAFCYELGR
jgi:hypothetical protein